MEAGGEWGVERVNRLGGGGGDGDESCTSVRAGGRERSTVKRKGMLGSGGRERGRGVQ